MTEASVVTLWGGPSEARTPYLTRVVLGSLRLHVFHRGDADPDCHDHPSDFWTFPLTSYVEEYVRLGQKHLRVVKAFRLHLRRAEFAHRVIARWSGRKAVALDHPSATDERPIATIVWWGRKRRSWGFHTAQGWVPWRVYLNEPEA